MITNLNKYKILQGYNLKPTKNEIILPTAETVKKGNYKYLETAKAGTFILKNVDCDILNKYLSRKDISNSQYSAGTKYYMNYKIGHNNPSIISSYKERSETHNPLEISENAVNSKLQYEAARKNIPYKMVKFFEYVVLDNMTLSEANKISLRLTNKKTPFKKFKICLDILAYHYGFI